MTKDDFYTLARICATNRALAKNGNPTLETREQSEAMADCIAYDILELARKQFYAMTHREWETFRENFFELAQVG